MFISPEVQASATMYPKSPNRAIAHALASAQRKETRPRASATRLGKVHARTCHNIGLRYRYTHQPRAQQKQLLSHKKNPSGKNITSRNEQHHDSGLRRGAAAGGYQDSPPPPSPVPYNNSSWKKNKPIYAVPMGLAQKLSYQIQHPTRTETSSQREDRDVKRVFTQEKSWRVM